MGNVQCQDDFHKIRGYYYLRTISKCSKPITAVLQTQRTATDYRLTMQVGREKICTHVSSQQWSACDSMYNVYSCLVLTGFLLLVMCSLAKKGRTSNQNGFVLRAR